MNPRPQESQSCALPTELRPPLNLCTNRPAAHAATSQCDHQPRSGAPGRIRTCYPRLRRPMLYPNELRALCRTALLACRAICPSCRAVNANSCPPGIYTVKQPDTLQTCATSLQTTGLQTTVQQTIGQQTTDVKIGRGSRIRTCDPLLPKQMRYQAALCPDLKLTCYDLNSVQI